MKTMFLCLFNSHGGIFSAVSFIGLLFLGIAVPLVGAQSPGQEPTRDIEVTDVEKGQSNTHVITVPSTVSSQILPLVATVLPQWNVHPNPSPIGKILEPIPQSPRWARCREFAASLASPWSTQSLAG